jgi:hypothetical protein
VEQFAAGIAEEALQLPRGSEQPARPIQLLDALGQVTEQGEQLLLAGPAVYFVVITHVVQSRPAASLDRRLVSVDEAGI